MKKYRLIIVCLLIVLAFLLFNLCNGNRRPIIETFNVDSTTEEDTTDELIIALFIEDITKEAGLIYVKFGVTSQIGAHNPLGYDEIAYKVDSRGNKELAGYEYLKNYEMPEKFCCINRNKIIKCR